MNLLAVFVLICPKLGPLEVEGELEDDVIDGSCE